MYAPLPESDGPAREAPGSGYIPPPPPINISDVRADTREASAPRAWLKVPSEKPFWTPVLLAIIVLVFVAMSIMGGSADSTEGRDLAIAWGAKVNGLIYQGEWWRLIASTFLHGGLLHLFLNGSALYFIGMDLEGFIGRRRFLAVYFISALGGSVASFIFSPFNIPGVGASGAIFGLVGALGVFFGLNRRLFGRIGTAQFRMILVVIGLNLLFGIGLGFARVAMIDNWAHLGGLAAGLASGLALVPRYRLGGWTAPNVREVLKVEGGSISWVAAGLIALSLVFLFLVSLLLITSGYVTPR